MKRKSSLSRSSPLRSGGALKRSKIKPVSKKRKKQERMKAGPDCEITKYLAGVVAWERFSEAFAGRDDLWAIRDPHHVWGHPAKCDESWNVVTVSRVAHEFEDGCWMQAGLLVCMYALWKAGRFEPETVRERIGKCPLGVLSIWHTDDGLFDDEPVLWGYAEELLDEYET